MKNNIIIAAIIFVSIFIGSCGALKTKYADLTYEEKKKDNKLNDKSDHDFQKDLFAYELADRFGLMAHFADVVYRDDLIEKKQIYSEKRKLTNVILIKDKTDLACEYLKPDIEAAIEGMPFITAADGSVAGRWVRWKGNKNVESEPCFDKQGLFYETYVFPSQGPIEEAVIAFRGTENRGKQFWYDWTTNISNLFGFEPKQYEIAAEKIPKVIKALKEGNKHIKIYATGHSLGGGLAQQAGYLSKDIKEVFTFNTSPVTNWTNLALRGDVGNAYPIIHRIYNGGEALGGIRSITTLFNNTRYGRHDIGIQVGPKELVAGHSMRLLKCHLACLIEQRGEDGNDNPSINAEHYFSTTYIRNELIPSMFNKQSRTYDKDKDCNGYVFQGDCELTGEVDVARD